MPKVRRWIAVVALLALVQGLGPFLGVAPVAAATRIPPAPFTDAYSTKYQDAVGLLYLLKVANGTAPYTFGVTDTVTRAQMAAFLLRSLDEKPSGSPTHVFPDVPDTYWANPTIARAVELGLLKGDSTGRFRPDDPVNYAEAITMLIRALGYESQLAPEEWPVNYVLKASSIGLLNGVDFQLYNPGIRGEVAVLLANAIFKVKGAATGLTLNASKFQAVSALRILPATGVITASTMQLSLEGTDWFGNAFPVSGQWATLSANASVNDQGVLTVTGSGTVVVQATRGETMASATFTRVQAVAVVPATVTAAVGSTVQFTATGTSEDKQVLPVEVAWSATGPGSIDPSTGVLSVTGPGTITVSAVATGVNAKATVTAVDSLRIGPVVSSAILGQTIKFSATGTGGVTLSTPVLWSIQSGGGSLSSSGEYTPGGLGHVVVRASAGSLVTDAEFDVVSGLRITPSPASLTLGQTQQFTAQVQGTAGWKDVTATWSLDNADLGVLSNTGLLAATGGGTGSISAHYGNLAATAPVTVAGAAVGIRLSASRTTLPANGNSTATITATFVDARGLATTAPGSQVLFSLSSSALGTLSAYSVPVTANQAVVTFTPGGTATSGSVIAYGPGTTLSAGTLSLITLAPVLSAIKLSAYPTPLASDGVSQSTVTATLMDQDGQPMSNNTGSYISMTLAATGSAGTLLNSSISIAPGSQAGTALFQAGGAPGTSNITGSASYTVQSVQVASVKVGAPAKLNIRTPVTDTIADGTRQMSVTVEVQDANGYVVTGDNTDLISLAGSGPGSINTGSLTVTGGTATFRLTTTKAGVYTLAASGLSNSSLRTAQSTVNFLSGPATSLDLALDPNVPAVTADGATSVRLVSRVLDANGNLVTTANTAVTFQQQTATAFDNIGSVTVNALNGIASISIKPTVRVGTDTFTATASGLSSAGPLAVQTRITGGAYKVLVRTPSSASVVAGETLNVSVWVTDSVGQVLTNDSGRSIALVLNDSTAVSNSPQTTVNGVAKFTIVPKRSGTLTMKTLASGLVSDNTGASVAVLAAPADHVALNANSTSVAADGVSALTVTPQLLDVYGNQAAAQVAVALSVSDSRYGRLSVTSASSGYSVSFYPTNVPGPVTITGTASYPVVPLTLTTYIAGAASRVVVDPSQSVTAGSTGSNAMQITVRVTDESGHTISSLNSNAAYGSLGIVSVAYLTVVAGNGATCTLTPTANYPLPPGTNYPNGQTTAGAYLINGTATFTFSDTKAETVTFVPTLSIGSTLLTSVSASATVTPGPAATVVINATPGAVNALTTSLVSITASLADAYGNAIASPADSFTFALNSNQLLAPTGGLTAISTGGGAAVTLQSKPGSSGTTFVTAVSGKTSLSSAPTPIVQDFLPDKPYAYASSYSGSGVMYAADPAIKVTVTTSPRLLDQTLTVYLNGVQVPLYASSGGGSLVSAISAGNNALVGYVLHSDFGGPGSKSLTVVAQDAVGTGALSDPYTVQLQ